MWTNSKIRESDVESRAQGSDLIPSSTSFASGSWMLRTRCCRASGRTREHEYGEGADPVLFSLTRLQFMQVALLLWDGWAQVRRAAYPFSCMPSGPFLPHPRARGCSRDNKHKHTATVRKRGERAIGLLSCLQISAHRPRRDLGKLPAGGFHRDRCTVAAAAGPSHGGAKSLLDLRCGMVWWPQIILCRHRADLPVTAGGPASLLKLPTGC